MHSRQPKSHAGRNTKSKGQLPADSPFQEAPDDPCDDYDTIDAPENAGDSFLDEDSTSARCPPRQLWYETPLPDILEHLTPERQSWSNEIVQELKIKAVAILRKESKRFRYARAKKSPDGEAFLKMAFSNRATRKDKLNAMAAAVLESPLHQLDVLEKLHELATNTTARRDALNVVDLLRDLYSGNTLYFRNPEEMQKEIGVPPPTVPDEQDTYQRLGLTWVYVSGGLLPPNRALHFLKDQPGLVHRKSIDTVSDRELMLWYFEERIRVLFYELLTIIEKIAQDQVPEIRMRSLKATNALVVAKPRAELHNIIQLMTSKLTDKPLSSTAMFFINSLARFKRCWPHPSGSGCSWDTVGIGSDVVKALGTFLTRTKDESAQLVAIQALNQIPLSGRRIDIKLAYDLLETYFKFFKGVWSRFETIYSLPNKCRKSQRTRRRKKGSAVAHGAGERPVAPPDQGLLEKIVAEVLTGVRRAYPFLLPYIRENVVLDDISNLGRMAPPDEVRQLMVSHVEALGKAAKQTRFFGARLQALKVLHLLIRESTVNEDKFNRLFDRLLSESDVLVQASKRRSSILLSLVFRVLATDYDRERSKVRIKRLWDLVLAAQPVDFGWVVALAWMSIELEKLETRGTLLDSSAVTEYPVENLDVEGFEQNLGDCIREHRTKFWELPLMRRHFHPVAGLLTHQIFGASRRPVIGNFDPLERYGLARWLDSCAGIPRKEKGERKTYKRPFVKASFEHNDWLPSAAKRASTVEFSVRQTLGAVDERCLFLPTEAELEQLKIPPVEPTGDSDTRKRKGVETGKKSLGQLSLCEVPVDLQCFYMHICAQRSRKCEQLHTKSRSEKGGDGAGVGGDGDMLDDAYALAGVSEADIEKELFGKRAKFIGDEASDESQDDMPCGESDFEGSEGETDASPSSGDDEGSEYEGRESNYSDDEKSQDEDGVDRDDGPPVPTAYLPPPKAKMHFDGATPSLRGLKRPAATRLSRFPQTHKLRKGLVRGSAVGTHDAA